MSAFWRLLGDAPRGRLLALFVLMILASLSEGIGLLLLVPLLEILDGVGGQAASQNALVQGLLRALSFVGLAPTIGGLLLAFLGLVLLRSLIQYSRERVGLSLQLQLVDRLRLRAYSALLGVEWRWIAASRRADQGNLLLTLVLIFSRVIPLFMSAQQQLHHWLHALPALEETEQMLADCRAAAEPAADPDTQRGPQRWPVHEAIELDSVRLTYTERDRPALDGVSLRLPARTSTAIMGASGAGKSTLADVLMGLLEPEEGQLRIDGEPVTGAHRRAWRRSVAYVPQEVFLFNDSIRNNLLWGLADASEDALRLALQRAAADFVFDLPEGLETRVGDSGVRVSGGERQRLAVARALLKQPSLLILDEATSALDRENEARVRVAIEQLHGDLTLVVIGHRLATLEHADQVVVLEAGRVATKGTWASVRAHFEDAA